VTKNQITILDVYKLHRASYENVIRVKIKPFRDKISKISSSTLVIITRNSKPSKELSKIFIENYPKKGSLVASFVSNGIKISNLNFF
jgi:hypothetical protein